jgi:HEPN domain-containing protein
MKIDEIKEWYDAADSDYYTAQILNKEYYRKPCEQICYNCTQAVEKYLKGFLLYNDKDINYNHNLSELIRNCENVDSSFNLLIQKCDILNKYSYSNLRYPPKLNINEKDSEISLNIVSDFINSKPIKDLAAIINDLKRKNINELVFIKYSCEKEKLSVPVVKETVLDKDKNILKVISDIDDEKRYVIQRKRNGQEWDIWIFKNNFENSIGLEFVESYDNNKIKLPVS